MFRFEYKGHRVFVWTAVVTVLLASAMVLAVIRFRAYSHVFAATHEVLTAIVELQASTARAESSARGYLLTGETRFLEEFAASRTDVERDRDLLAARHADAGESSSQFFQLSLAVTRRLEHLAQVVASRQTGQSVEQIRKEHEEEGRHLAGAIVTLLSSAKSDQEKLLAARRWQRHQMELAVMMLCGFGAALSVALVVVGLRAMRNDLRLRTQAQEELRTTNAELEKRVLDRTESIQRANIELQRSQVELSAIANALERSNTDLETFAYAATHDLQEPLRTVTLFAQLLQSRKGDASESEQNFYLQTIITQVERMTELIQGVLEYSRVSREPVERSQAVDLNEVTRVVSENLSAQIRESGAELKYSPLPVLHASRLQMIRLLQNLIGNSLKYRSPERPCRIDVSAHRDGEFWTIAVHDNGMGFKPEYGQYIFGMFKRLDRPLAGAGVGLATCKAIVERYGGRIWADAQEGAGATFCFTWPAAQIARSNAHSA